MTLSIIAKPLDWKKGIIHPARLPKCAGFIVSSTSAFACGTQKYEKDRHCGYLCRTLEVSEVPQ
jgi:hypothetical protein